MAQVADLICSVAVLAALAGVVLLYGVRARLSVRLSVRLTEGADEHAGSAVPAPVRAMALWMLQPLVRTMVGAGVSASAITGASLVLGAFAGALLAVGHFGVAAVAIILASLGDALDGLVARRARTASPAGALFDASVDRYEEFFVLGGLAVFFHADPRILVLVLLALLGSFMVSYGSAKAEAFRVSVPSSWMRRAERAICLSAGTVLVPVAALGAHFLTLPAWVAYSPVLLAVALVAVVGNVSAVRRLQWVAAAANAAAAAASAPAAIVMPKRIRPAVAAPRESVAQPELARRRLGA
jgi:CDP-diacylglycerol--glycerol-3-phosphate 3-phosphatidyltransferase